MRYATLSEEQKYTGVGHARTLVFIVGIIDVIIGAALVANLHAAVTTIVVIAGLSLVVGGIGDLIMSEGSGAFSKLGGLIMMAGGVAAVAWPNITLWVLAVIAGTVLVVSGFGNISGALTNNEGVEHRGWRLLGGVVTLVAGLVALAWPSATVAVLALIFGVRVVVAGITTLFVAARMSPQDAVSTR